MRRGDTLFYSSHEPVHLHNFLLGVWRANGAVRASYPEDGANIMVGKILESKGKWFLCDPHTAPEVLLAVKSIPWPVEVLVFGQAKGCTPVTELFHDDGEGESHCLICILNMNIK